ncbi:hypothetical protein [Brevundimonas sp.]|uniref:hypothetical protein n=1 Tax=Brevundimonas sp. TaxID=1871086 RepID=UPI003562C53E
MVSDDVVQFLKKHGPSRAGRIAEAFVKKGASAEAARQRVFRTRSGIHRFPVQVLPKREAFLYLHSQRSQEIFWANLMRDLRETNSVFGAALDGMAARGGFVTESEFAVISAAYAYPQRGQVTSHALAKSMLAADFIRQYRNEELGKGYLLCPGLALGLGEKDVRARRTAERVLIDAVREWARKIGFAGYNSISVRGEERLTPIGPFSYDLAGPSYLLPLKREKQEFGFLVADVFVDRVMTVHDIQYFIRKARMTRSALPSAGVVSILVAERFTGEALTAGHRAGIMLATPYDLFGRRTGAALASLVETLKNAAAYAASSPKRLLDLVDNLSDIEGRAGNLRGILFELLVAYLVRRNAASIDMGIIARDPDTQKPVDMDVIAFNNAGSDIRTIECKAKEPGGVLTLAEVDEWLTKIAVMRAHYKNDPYRREAKLQFELWTTGTIEADALVKLAAEKAARTRTPIDWKDGQAVLAVAKADKEKGITDALYQHFIRHPLVTVAVEGRASGLVVPSVFPDLDTELGGGAASRPKLTALSRDNLPMVAMPLWRDRIDDFGDLDED